MALTALSNSIRVISAKSVLDSVSTSNYYLGIGRVKPWVPTADSPSASDISPPNAILTNDTINEVWDNAIGLKKITSNDMSMAIRRINWTSGVVYDMYSSSDTNLSTNDFYVMTSNYEIFKCYYNNEGSPSTAMPTIPVPNTVDGYIWRYMYTVPLGDRTKFLMTDFIPVKNTPATPINGEIVSLDVISGGSGYSTAPTVTITGSGTGATATAVINSGSVVKIIMNTRGVNYTNATISFIGSNITEAAAVANIAPLNGHGSNILEELYATNVIISIQLSYDESGTLLTNNDIRQAFIVKDPYTQALTVANIAGSRLTTLATLSGDTTNFTQDQVVNIYSSSNIIGTAVIVYNDTLNKTLYLTNITSPIIVDSYAINDGVTTIPISAGGVSLPNIKPHTGQVVYILNRTPVNRNPAQIETFRIPLRW